MRIALPTEGGAVSAHFGQCTGFALFDVDEERGTIIASASVSAPDHSLGFLPRWLADMGVKCVITGSIGKTATAIFEGLGVRVVTGAPPEGPAPVVARFLARIPFEGENRCGR